MGADLCYIALNSRTAAELNRMPSSLGALAFVDGRIPFQAKYAT